MTDTRGLVIVALVATVPLAIIVLVLVLRGYAVHLHLRPPRRRDGR